MFTRYSTFNVQYLYTLFVQQDSGENFMNFFEYMTVFNKQMITQCIINGERTYCDKYRLSCKKNFVI